MLNKGIKAERKLAKDIDGKTTPASGASIIKGDIITDRFVIQSKYTDKKSFSLKLKDLLQAEADALHEGREPLFMIEFSGRRYWVLSNYMMEDLLSKKEND